MKTEMKNDEETNQEAVIWCATDIHYLAPSLYDQGSAYQSLLRGNDGKLFEYDKEIMEKLTQDIIAAEPDAFLFTGDLTFNGEMESLQELKTYLSRIEEAGIPVLVVPGNHDISYPHANAYIGDIVKSVPAVTFAQFREEMADFGYGDSILKDEGSFSYAYALRDDLWIIALDANTEEKPGALRTETKEWLQDTLAEANRRNITVITMSHQNVLKQSDMLYVGYVMNDYQEVQKILKKGNVFLHLSGHSHLQHISQEDGLTDICSEALSVWPLSYSIITIQAHTSEFGYEKAGLGIYQEEAQARFDETVLRMVVPMLAERDIPDEIREEMIRLAVTVNEHFYTGMEIDYDALKNDPALSYWHDYAGDTFWFGYINTILNTAH